MSSCDGGNCRELVYGGCFNCLLDVFLLELVGYVCLLRCSLGLVCWIYIDEDGCCLDFYFFLFSLWIGCIMDGGVWILGYIVNGLFF